MVEVADVLCAIKEYPHTDMSAAARGRWSR
ncbi:hypothetical protein NKI08_34315 [Mesorhizobium sp. M0768]